jgi:DNA-binding transcriptional MerR regulator
MSAHYRIGEFAELSGVSVKTLRFYDKIHLLRPISVDSRTRYRLYQSQQLQDLASILALKELGIPLSDVRHALSKAGSVKERQQLLEQLRDTVERSIEAAKQSLKWITAAVDELNDLERPPSVVVKRRSAVRVASVRSHVGSYSDILPLEQELLGALPAHSVGSLRGVLWHRCADSGCLEGEPFVELKREVPLRGLYELKHLPPATLACAYSGLDDSAAERAYAAIRNWMQVRGYRLAGAKREIYLDQMLEIQFPLRSA